MMASDASLRSVTFTRNRNLNPVCIITSPRCLSLGRKKTKRAQSDATVERLRQRVPFCSGWPRTSASVVVLIMVGSLRQLECFGNAKVLQGDRRERWAIGCGPNRQYARRTCTISLVVAVHLLGPSLVAELYTSVCLIQPLHFYMLNSCLSQSMERSSTDAANIFILPQDEQYVSADTTDLYHRFSAQKRYVCLVRLTSCHSD